jgi:hypothetical protein
MFKKTDSELICRSQIHVDKDRLMIKIQALEWVQGTIQDIILNNVTRNWPVYDK